MVGVVVRVVVGVGLLSGVVNRVVVAVVVVVWGRSTPFRPANRPTNLQAGFASFRDDGPIVEGMNGINSQSSKLELRTKQTNEKM